jgi:predicted transcriptional regulator
MQTIDATLEIPTEQQEIDPERLAWLEAEVQKGRDDIEAGRFFTHEEMREKLRKLGVKCE